MNNKNANFDDHLYKTKPIIDKLRENYRKYYNLPEIVPMSPFYRFAAFLDNI